MTVDERPPEHAASDAEPGWVVERLVAETGVEPAALRPILTACRDAADELLGQDYSIVVPPLTLSRRGNPVCEAFDARIREGSDLPRWDRMEDEELAAFLDVDLEWVQTYPVASLFLLVALTAERLGVPLDDEPRLRQLWAVLGAWFDTFRDRDYQWRRQCLEVEFERWLVDNLDQLARLGYPVELAAQQRPMANRLRPDLLCRFTQNCDDARRGDWLVIENKTVPAYPAAVAQLAGYLPLVAAERATGDEQVIGLLIADGCPEPVLELLDDTDLGYLPLAALGYPRRGA